MVWKPTQSPNGVSTLRHFAVLVLLISPFEFFSDCEDVSQDALAVFRALRNVDASKHRDLKALQAFAEDYTCYMVLGMATMASAEGKASGKPMAHMWNMIMPNNYKEIGTKGIFLVESTGWVNPIPHKDDIGLTPKGKAYMARLNLEKNEEGAFPRGSYLGLIKRMLSDWPKKTGDKDDFVVSEFYTRICYGIPHNDGDIVGFLDNDGNLGPYLSQVMQNQNFTVETIKGTGYAQGIKDAECKQYMDMAERSIEPIPAYQLVNKANLPVALKKFNERINVVVRRYGKGNLKPENADGRVLILGQVLENTKVEAEERILGKNGWLDYALKNDLEDVKVDMQIVGKPGANDADALVAWMVSFKLKGTSSRPLPAAAATFISPQINNLIF